MALETETAVSLPFDQDLEDEAGQEFGPYKIVRPLGRGGMGAVYLAEQQRPFRRVVALKLIKPGMDTREVIARFESERQALALMDHPNIARVYDAGSGTGGRPYFAMEYVPGIPIADYCDQNRLTNRERLELYIPVCQAVQHAHQKGVIHRDLKPSNVLVTVQDGAAVPKVIDFGVAKAINQKLTARTLFTQHGVLLGTPEYMSPEQADGRDIDATSDIYSLGVLLYQLLVGVLPFDPRLLREAGYNEILRVIREEETPRPSARLYSLGSQAVQIAERHRTTPEGLTKQLRGDLDWITVKAIEKERSRRYPSVSELAADIRRHLHDEPIQARPPSPFYLWHKCFLRHKFLISASLLIIFSLLCWSVVATWQARVANVRQHAAEWRSYVSNLNAAALHLRSNEVTQARQRLLSCPPQLRDWEWKHLFRQIDSSLASLLPPLADLPPGGISNRTSSLGFNSGRDAIFWLASPVSVLWSWEGRDYRFSADETNFGPLLAINADATKVIAAPYGPIAPNPEYDLAVFDLKARSVIAKVQRLALRISGDPSFLRAVFSPDGSRAVAITVSSHEISGRIVPKSRLIVWETNSGRILGDIETGSFVFRAVFSPDGGHLLFGTLENTTLWDVASAKPLLQLAGSATTVAFSPDGRRIAAGSPDGATRIWDSSTGRLIFEARDQQLPTTRGQVLVGVDAIAFSPDSRKVLTATADYVIRIRDATSGELRDTFLGHTGRVTSIAFTPDGTRVLSDQQHPPSVKVWSADFCCAVKFIVGDQQPVKAVAISPDQRLLASGADDGSVRLFDVSTARMIRILQGHNAAVDAIAFSPDGQIFASGSEDGSIIVWDLNSENPVRTLVGHAAGVTSLAFKADGKQLVSGSSDKTIRVWNPSLGMQLNQIDAGDVVNSVALGHGNRILSALGSRIGGRLAAGPSVKVWDGSSGKDLVAEAAPGMNTALSASFNPDGTRIIAALANGTAAIWATASGRLLGTIRSSAFGISAAAFHSAGTRIFTSSGNTIELWDSRSLERVFALSGHGAVTDELCFAFSRDGSILAAGFHDGTLAIWKTTQSSY